MLLTHPLSIDEVNGLLSENFVRIFGNIVDHFPAAAIVILKKRPFSDVNDIVQAVFSYLDSLKVTGKLPLCCRGKSNFTFSIFFRRKRKILHLYPDVLSQLAYLSQWPPEKEIVGTDHLTTEEKRRLRDLNNRYKEKFGFPFVIGLKEKDVWTVFSEVVSRLQNDYEKEIHTAFDEVKNIVKLRIHEIVR
ncbi:hypothetical protein NQ318_003641 [Aromia moschata]|uniref:2-oxo-4-hydroxy-4-carboxy-5-ureidoimidazoline decarboxylase n=1 Tax=Aromia moschata TaxID=1265417 RepID=A0AAV8Y054_9CUCU|nr:hypothetical protein NQ318_003641 [Aromia moschata]